MTDSESLQLPDVLGALTGGERCAIGVLQLALGVRPRVARAGRPFEVLLLAQNTVDAPVDLTAVLQLPDGFVSRRARIVVGLSPMESGYVTLPVAAMAQTPAGSSYKIAMAVEVRVEGSPPRARPPERGLMLGSDDLSAENADRVEALKGVEFSTAKKFGRNSLETSIDLLSGSIGRIVDYQPGWVSLWTLVDLRDEAALLHRFADLFRFRVLPGLQRAHTLGPLAEETASRFAGAGYPLKPVEALMIAKVMALLLEYAMPKESAHSPIAAGSYNVVPLLSHDRHLEAAPRWFHGMIRALARDQRGAFHAASVVQKLLYDELLHDAVLFAFETVSVATGEDLGREADRLHFADRLIDGLKTHEGIDFFNTYLPLVICGIMVNGQISAADENTIETMRLMWTALDERRPESGDHDQALLDLVETTIQRTLETYGFNRRQT